MAAKNYFTYFTAHTIHMSTLLRLHSIADLSSLFELANITHPLVAVIDFGKVSGRYSENLRIATDFYAIMFKNYCQNTVRYGRKNIDFQDGSLMCMAPQQLIEIDTEEENKADKLGWGLFFHPDFIRASSLNEKMKEYSFFTYTVTEALHLSDKEKHTLHDCILKIETELQENIDIHSQHIIISTIELLLNYCQRFYGRQLITRSNSNKALVAVVEDILRHYFSTATDDAQGLPTVKNLAERVNLSPGYLSDLLKKETGMSAQEHIHYCLLEEAKNRLINTDDHINEVAYSLGFEYPQYFVKLFKQKTGQTPTAYRHAQG